MPYTNQTHKIISFLSKVGSTFGMFSGGAVLGARDVVIGAPFFY